MTEFFSLTLPQGVHPFAIINETFDWAVIHTVWGNFDPQIVHLLASAPSMSQVNLDKICQQPCIFVNGSIELTQHYSFNQAMAYVITDPRFIRHNLAILQTCYQAQCPLFITQSVLLALLEKCPEFLAKFHATIYLIFAVDRPILSVKKRGILGKIFTKKLKLSDFQQSPYHVIKNDIGVSLDIRHGFVEAGTVTYVATQLAYSLGFRRMVIHGMDLINAHEPRFYENHQNATPSKLDAAVANRIVPSFELLAQVYAARQVTVLNGSPVSNALFTNLHFTNEFLNVD